MNKNTPNKQFLSSNFKKVLANVEMQDQKQLATVVEKLKTSKIDFEFQWNIAVEKDISKLAFNIDMDVTFLFNFRAVKSQ